MFDFLIDQVKTHGIIGAAVLLLAYVGREHIKADEKVLERVTALETDRVKREDLRKLYDIMDAGFKESRQQNQTIMVMLARPWNERQPPPAQAPAPPAT